uniref:Uncharacterized protein n=1 Tax=Lepeophtheirus salmonis TaxID=72036 RepID=A0A0K2U6U3_LEPSM
MSQNLLESNYVLHHDGLDGSFSRNIRIYESESTHCSIELICAYDIGIRIFVMLRDLISSEKALAPYSIDIISFNGSISHCGDIFYRPTKSVSSSYIGSNTHLPP